MTCSVFKFAGLEQSVTYRWGFNYGRHCNKYLKTCQMDSVKNALAHNFEHPLTISFPFIVCNGILSSRLPRARRINCKPEVVLLFNLCPLAAESALRKQPSIRTCSYVIGSERGPARANLIVNFLLSSLSFLSISSSSSCVR